MTTHKRVTTTTSGLPPLFNFEPSCTVIIDDVISSRGCQDLVALRDGSFLSCSHDRTTKRWISYPPTTTTTPTTTNTNDTSGFVLAGTYKGHTLAVLCAVEKDDDTLITGSSDNTVRVWNKTTCEECRPKIILNCSIWSLRKTRDDRYLLCGLGSGIVEVLCLTDLRSIGVTNFKLNDIVSNICELEDGTFVVTSGREMSRWSIEETTAVWHQTFDGHVAEVTKVIELKRDVIVSSAWDYQIKIWQASTGECLRTLQRHNPVLVKLRSTGYFASGLKDQTVIWDDKGNRVASYHTSHPISLLAELADGTIVTGNRYEVEIRKPYVLDLRLPFQLHSQPTDSKNLTQIADESGRKVLHCYCEISQHREQCI